MSDTRDSQLTRTLIKLRDAAAEMHGGCLNNQSFHFRQCSLCQAAAEADALLAAPVTPQDPHRPCEGVTLDNCYLHSIPALEALRAKSSPSSTDAPVVDHSKIKTPKIDPLAEAYDEYGAWLAWLGKHPTNFNDSLEGLTDDIDVRTRLYGIMCDLAGPQRPWLAAEPRQPEAAPVPIWDPVPHDAASWPKGEVWVRWSACNYRTMAIMVGPQGVYVINDCGVPETLHYDWLTEYAELSTDGGASWQPCTRPAPAAEGEVARG